MLSIGEVSAGNAGYYVSLAHVDDYYRENAEPGRWWGKGTQGLELDDSVRPKPFRALLQGFHPKDGDPLVQNAGDFSSKRARRAGFDLTFSAPKSVSTLFAASDEPTRSAILAAHQNAVDTALSSIEHIAARTRTGHNGINVIKARGLTVAQFDHFTSREGDPQIHTHSVVLNLAEAEGKWRALDTRGLFTHGRKLEWGALYRDCLREELGRKLGISFRDTPEKGASTWEIRGIPQSILDEHSKRRAQILEHGYKSAAEASLAALKTRTPKLENPKTRAELFDAWRQDLQGKHRDVFSIERLRELGNRQPSPPSGVPPSRPEKPILRPHPQEAPQPGTLASLEKAAAILRESVSKTKNALAPRPSRIHEAFWPTRYGLDKGQRSAVRDVVRGSGATHLYRPIEDKAVIALARTYEHAGFRFYSLSLTSDRASELRKGGVNRAMTISGAMTVLKMSLLEKNLSLHGLKSAFWRPPNHVFPRVMNRGGAWLDSKSVLFVETSNYPNPAELAELRELAKKSGARVVFAGKETVSSPHANHARGFSSPFKLHKELRKRRERDFSLPGPSPPELGLNEQ